MNRVNIDTKKHGYLGMTNIDVIDSIVGDKDQAYIKLKSGRFVNLETGNTLTLEEEWILSDKLAIHGVSDD